MSRLAVGTAAAQPALNFATSDRALSHLELQLVRKLGGDGALFEGLKLHRPAASYTLHPRWAELTGPHCSFEEACSLLAGGVAEDFLEQPPAADGKLRGRGREAQIAWRQRPTQQQQQQQQQQRPRQEQQAAAGGGSGKRPREAKQCSSGSSSDSEESTTEEGSSGEVSSCCGHSREAEQLPADMLPPGGSSRPQQGQGSRAGNTNMWSGLDPENSGCYCMRVSPSLVPAPGRKTKGNTYIPSEGKSCPMCLCKCTPGYCCSGQLLMKGLPADATCFPSLSLSGRYLEAICGCADPPQQLLLTTPDGRWAGACPFMGWPAAAMADT